MTHRASDRSRARSTFAKALTLAVVAAVVGLVPAISATAAGPSPDGFVSGHYLTGARDWTWANARHTLLVRNNIYSPYVSQTTYVPGGPAYAVTRFTGTPAPGQVGSFPDIQYGENMWGLTTEHSHLPMRAGLVGKFSISVAGGLGPSPYERANFASDIWYSHGLPGEGSGNQTGPCTNRAELMIWYRHRSVGVVTNWRVRLDGRTWLVAHWITGGGAANDFCRWQYIQFRLRDGSNKWHGSVLPMVRFAEAHGWIKTGWWLSSANLGHETWQDGKGNHIGFYSVYVRNLADSIVWK
jgi:Glycosyl hydrolase family 12